jgi:hypothetical protein
LRGPPYVERLPIAAVTKLMSSCAQRGRAEVALLSVHVEPDRGELSGLATESLDVIDSRDLLPGVNQHCERFPEYRGRGKRLVPVYFLRILRRIGVLRLEGCYCFAFGILKESVRLDVAGDAIARREDWIASFGTDIGVGNRSIELRLCPRSDTCS